MPRKPKTPDEPLAVDADFVKALEQGIRRVLSDPRATPNQLSQAVNAGVKLESFRHKSKEGDDDSHTFFK